MPKNIAVIIGAFHKKEGDEMLDEVKAFAGENNLKIVQERWVPGSMEKPLALKRALLDESVDGAVVLGIIERGETEHGLVMGQAVTSAIIGLQLEMMKPVGVGILGPGILPEQIPPRVRPYARNAVKALAAVLQQRPNNMSFIESISFTNALARHNRLFGRLTTLEGDCHRLAEDMKDCLDIGGKIMFMGNGGSAADCQHLAAELVVRYKTERQPLAAMALTVDTSILTAHANDYSFDTVFTRQVQALCRPEDLLIGISTSGNSPNIIDALAVGKAMGARTWAWTGQSGGKLAGVADFLLRVPDTETARIQEAHIFIGHWLCEALDESGQSDKFAPEHLQK